ncbi:MAG: hypothetical protein HOV67_00160 [Kribbellaceae bacterium]|nr:hypothetical protein [Kribbellaceae bacterium]
MGTDAPEPQELVAAGEPQGSGEALTPDAVSLAKERNEARNVNNEAAYPGLDKVDLTRVRRRNLGGRGRGGGFGQTAGKEQERGRNR